MRPHPKRAAPVMKTCQRCDLATAIKFLEHDFGYRGAYTIEASNGHEGTQAIYDVVVATV